VSGATKADTGKPDLSFVPRELRAAAARAFEFGARKYAPGNWLKGGLTQRRLLAALSRHIDAYTDREDADPESGLCHLDHAAACLAMLCATRERGLGPDDRLPERTEPLPADGPRPPELNPLLSPCGKYRLTETGIGRRRRGCDPCPTTCNAARGWDEPCWEPVS
jgi:hypothetical protein